MENKIELIKTLVIEIESDLNKYQYKNNKSAGTRVRTSLSKLRKLAQEIRMDILEQRRSKE